MSASPYRTPCALPAPVERIEHRMWWSDGEIAPGVVAAPPCWLPVQTYVYAKHGCWTIPTKPWVIVEERP